MKNLVIIALLSVLFTACESNKVLAENEIPSAITNYLQTHFPNHKVLQVEKEREGLSKSYDVILEGNIVLEFNKKHNNKSIEAKSALPQSVIPAIIWDYVQREYPGVGILEYELDDNRQKVELDNRLELEFNKAGDFLRLD